MTEACPACGGRQSAQVGGSASAFEIEAHGRRLRQPEYGVRQCLTCDLYFKDVTVDALALPDHYSDQPFAVYEHGAAFPTERQVTAWLDRLPDGSAVLDFGCSTGRMLKASTRRLQCVGVEPNTVAAAIAKERGIRMVAASDLGTGDLAGFDAIILADVFEHLPAPLPQIEFLARLLSPGGWLAIVTGNADAIRHRAFLAEYWYFRSAEHLHMASERHMSWLAARAGLRLDALVRCSHYVTPLRDRARQFAQEFAYATFRTQPSSLAAAVLRQVPGLKRAEGWQAAPALTYRQDHLVAKFVQPLSI